MVMYCLHFVLAGFLFGLINADVRSEILCEDRDSPLNLSCESTKVIIVTKVTVPTDYCWYTSSSCANYMSDHIRENCNKKTSCNISTDALGQCDSFPRHLTIDYKCRLYFWRWRSETLSVCTDSLHEVSCFYLNKIDINSIKLTYSHQGCTHYQPECTENKLKELCDGRRKCKDAKERNTCLWQKKFVQVSYSCVDNSTENSFEPPTDELPTRPSQSTPVSTTLNDNNAVNDPQIEIGIDKAKRVIIFFSMYNITKTVCADGWNDQIASIVCKNVYGNQYGKAITFDNHPPLQNDSLVLNCTGNESSLFQCDLVDTICSSSMVAGVECCEEQECQAEPSYSKKKDQNGGSSSLEIGVGVSITVLVVVATILVFLYMRRRNLKSKEKQPRSHIGNRNDDYTGQQGIALPNISNGSPENYTVQYTSCPGFDIGTNQTNGRFLRSKPNSSASEPGDVDQSTYATSQDGIYDKAHDRRHIENEANTYGHSVDDMYDTSNHQQGYDVDRRSYGRVVDTVYDTSVHKSGSRVNVDDTYARAVDTANDTASRLGTIGRQDDAYD